MAVELVIHRGTHEIGGNCVELRTSRTRLILDVGMPLVDANGESFDAKSIDNKTVPQLIEEGTIPRVPGLFDDSSDQSSSPNAILLSHAHCDHTGLLRFTRKDIPVYLSPGTSDMMYVGLKFAGQKGVGTSRQHRFSPREPFRVGDFTITPHPVDHSAFDSTAFLIEGEERRVLYSGDLRLHGRKPGMAERLVQAVSENPVHALIMEGTHVMPGSHTGLREWDLEEELVEHIGQAHGLVLANFSPLHLDRLVGFYRATTDKRCRRVFVVDPYAALVMERASQYCSIPGPTATENIRVYFNSAFEKTYTKKSLQDLRQRLSSRTIKMDELRATPNRFVMVFRPSMVDDDFGGELPSHARCIYSYWSGYLNKPHWAELHAKLAAVQGDFIQAHTSGHIFAEHLADLVERLDPHRTMAVIPIHTFCPDAFSSLVERVVQLEDGESYQV
jgi:ribonuclease J